MVDKKNAQNYKTLGKTESKLITELTEMGLNFFSLNDASKILKYSKNNTYQIIHSLKNKG